MNMRNVALAAALAAAMWNVEALDGAGGYVDAPRDGKFLRIVVASRRVQMIDAMFMSEQMRHLAHLPTVLEPGDPGDGTKEIEQWRENPRTGCVLAFADGDPDGEMVSVRAKGVAAVVNMARLASDGPNDGVLASRMRKAAWSAVGVLLGQPVFAAGMESLKELDAVEAEEPKFEEALQLTRLAVKRGMTPRGRFSYRAACMQGWAPAPTSDVQRVMWERAKDPTARWRQDFGGKVK